ncbi:MAG TPA: hypothetical protein VFZ25_10685 [Chloroflexota bacterium]|nr:hypothetical protein [Chloroflexota bacterium]
MSSAKPTLHVIFTMDCQPASTQAAPDGPKNWEQSARSIDGFCTCLLRAGNIPTLFVTPRCAEEHGPSLEEFASAGVEVGLLVQPQSLGGGFGRHLGQYRRDQQRVIVETARERFQDALGRRPQSIRSVLFSASDETFSVVSELGFRQGSLSCPGRLVTKHAAVWDHAVGDPHYVDLTDRQKAGDHPFLEVPVTSDASPEQRRGGLAPDLTVENGTFVKWHQPLIESQLQRMERENVRFRALCLSTRNCFSYHDPTDLYRKILDDLTGHLRSLEAAYAVHPVSLVDAHADFRSG